MDLDRILHEKKNFAELVDADVEALLRDRPFKTEHLNLEFKSGFPRLSGSTKYNILKICKYIVGFSNEEGGIVIYGVADEIKDTAVEFPDYITGLTEGPTREDLSEWVKDRIHPLVESPAIRDFEVAGKKVVIIKVPSGINKPYCYVDPRSKAITVFKKTAGGVVALTPEQIRLFYQTSLIEQSERILRAARITQSAAPTETSVEEDLLTSHKKLTRPKLENITDFGYLGMFCYPDKDLDLSVNDLGAFLDRNRHHFSEAIRFAPNVDFVQNGASVGYFPRAIRQDIKSTVRVTVYKTGLVAYDSQVDSSMDRDHNVHPYWLSYEIQRHLQLAKAILKDHGVDSIHFVLHLENINDFHMTFGRTGFLDERIGSYTGAHGPIVKTIEFKDIHDHDGDKRNIVMPIVQEVMDEISRIFGFSETQRGVWHDDGTLHYVKGLENQR